jgi:hypothetical protein
MVGGGRERGKGGWIPTIANSFPREKLNPFTGKIPPAPVPLKGPPPRNYMTLEAKPQHEFWWGQQTSKL